MVLSFDDKSIQVSFFITYWRKSRKIKRRLCQFVSLNGKHP